MTRVEKRGAYIALMEDLIGLIEPKDSVKGYDSGLNQSCKCFNCITGNQDDDNHVFRVGTERDDRTDFFLEPCPALYTGNETIFDANNVQNKFKIVFIGLNPHRENAYLDNTITWNSLANYHTYTKSNSKSVYVRIANELLKANEYFDPVFRLHQALLYENRVYENWSAVQNAVQQNKSEWMYKDEKEYFLKEILLKPILNVEMIPYKSIKYELSDSKAKRFRTCIAGYMQYLIDLIELVEKTSEKNAWIVFLGHRKNVINILHDIPNNVFPSDYDMNENPYEDKIRPKTAEYTFNRFWWKGEKGGKRVVILPFLSGGVAITKFKSTGLITKIKGYFNN